MTPEFSRPHRLDQIGGGESQVTVTARPDERTALAKRFDLAALDRLEAVYTLRRDAGGVVARGHLSGAAAQRCVATSDPVPATIEEDFALRFLPEPGDSDDEVELSDDELDTVFYSGGAIDLGEAAAETLALALDPFPRSPRAEQVLREAGVVREDDAVPLSPLAAALQEKLAGK